MASAQTVARASDALRTLRERFRETSAGTITLLEDLSRQLASEPASADAIAALRRELHRVHGTAGSYGFSEASRLAAKLEQRVAGWEGDASLERTQRATIIGHFVSALRLAMSAEAGLGHATVSRRTVPVGSTGIASGVAPGTTRSSARAPAAAASACACLSGTWLSASP